MLVCWEWLGQYVNLDVQPDDLALRLAMSGLNHEGTAQVGEDTVIDLEVTSNRGDCLGHLGVAREVAVLLEQSLAIPDPQPATVSTPVDSLLQVANEFPEACPEYTARVLRGVRIGPSPAWLVRRLQAIGINSVNNVVDATNYVMMECGQPLHAFDLQHLRGGKIIVRPALAEEAFEAIDHKQYELDEQMVVIADGQRAVALGGVMGGVDSEVSSDTCDVVIEAARFTPLSIRRAARKLKLHSPSSYRFERMPDPAGLEWASLRCCELILELAGGELCEGAARAGQPAPAREAITLRFAQVARILGIDIPQPRMVSILEALGCEVSADAETARVTPPSWRTDLERECDLVEEVARIYGYEQIPENVAVPIGVANPRPKDTALERARHTLSAYGVDEAMTPSVVGDLLESFGSLWCSQPALSVDTPLLKGAKTLRRSLIPSLMQARHTNQKQSIRDAELYEVATIYLPQEDATALPREQSTLGLICGGNLQRVKGIVEDLLRQVAGLRATVEWQTHQSPLFEAGCGLSLTANSQPVGFVGLVSQQVLSQMGLEQPVAAAELTVDGLTDLLEPIRRAQPISAYPAISRDLNFIVDEALTWAVLATACSQHAGPLLQRVEYQETYRDPKKDGAGKKRTLLTLHFQSLERTLTGDEVDAAVQQVIDACQREHAAKLLA